MRHQRLRPEHLGMSWGDAKELGEPLDGGHVALIVIGESRVEEQLEKEPTRAVKSIEKEATPTTRRVQNTN